MKNEVTQELLFRYFAGVATAFQKQLIEEWAKEPQNRERFYEALEAWEAQNPQYLPDVTAARHRHQARLANPEAAPHRAIQESPSYPFFPRRVWLGWGIAASLVLLLGSGWIFRENLLNQTYATAYGETRQLTLPDGSRVTLNANSRLQFPRFGFGKRTREVALRGEATFSVVHTPDDRRFVVKTDRNFEVVVLGTEFTVYNRPRGGRVVLNRGKVQLRYGEGATTRQLTMKPGDAVTLDPRGQAQLRRLRQPENAAAWRENRFVFEETPLSEIARLFEENYGLHLQIPDPDLARWTVSGSFTARNADELLESLTQAASLNYVRRDDRIILTTP
ncbi:MAG: FecR domain-containing protein [Sphingobacteriaceae bacterium]|nr:FecR domain-containing protein [Cytophagaceae bacterium]